VKVMLDAVVVWTRRCSCGNLMKRAGDPWLVWKCEACGKESFVMFGYAGRNGNGSS